MSTLGEPKQEVVTPSPETALLSPCLRLTCSLAPDTPQITGTPFKLTVNRDCAACAELSTITTRHCAFHVRQACSLPASVSPKQSYEDNTIMSPHFTV